MFTRYRYKLVSCKVSEKNRFQNVFTVCNVALDAVVSDMFGKSASSILNYLLTSDDFNPDICTSFLQRSLKKKADEVIESIEGFSMEPVQKSRALMVRDHLEYLEQRIVALDKVLDLLVKPYESFITLLCTIPGVERHSAITIISEIGADMSWFASSKRICSWAGLTPSNNESAGKKKFVRISRAGVYLKPALVQVAHAAVKSDESSYYTRIKYERISKRRGKNELLLLLQE
jgi:transposase